MAGMKPEDARAYLTRWDLVREVEVAELRCTSLDAKLKQTEALVASRDLFKPDPDRLIEEREIQERWAKLRQALSA